MIASGTGCEGVTLASTVRISPPLAVSFSGFGAGVVKNHGASVPLSFWVVGGGVCQVDRRDPFHGYVLCIGRQGVLAASGAGTGQAFYAFGAA